jgi:hypothetical protein
VNRVAAQGEDNTGRQVSFSHGDTTQEALRHTGVVRDGHHVPKGTSMYMRKYLLSSFDGGVIADSSRCGYFGTLHIYPGYSAFVRNSGETTIFSHVAKLVRLAHNPLGGASASSPPRP